MVTRYLYSPSIDPNTMNMALIEGSQGKLGSSLDAIALWCMAYDPASNRYTAVGYKLLSLGAAHLFLMLLGLTAPFWFANRRPNSILLKLKQALNFDGQVYDTALVTSRRSSQLLVS